MNTLKLGSNNIDTLFLQSSLGIVSDGIFGKGTESAVKDYQRRNNLLDDGIVGSEMWGKLLSSQTTSLSELDYQNLSKKLNLETKLIKTVEKVESSKSAFYDSGRPTLLFEAHIFYKYLKSLERKDPDVYIKSHSNILSKNWNRNLYIGGEKEYSRLMEAWGLSRKASLYSASYGAFQICGFNFASCGCKDVFEFVGKMFKGKKEQLELFGNFISSTGKIKYLRDHDWAGFAKSYNGSGYSLNSYDKKLEKTYNSL